MNQKFYLIHGSSTKFFEIKTDTISNGWIYLSIIEQEIKGSGYAHKQMKIKYPDSLTKGKGRGKMNSITYTQEP